MSIFAPSPSASSSPARRWTARACATLAIAFLAFDAVVKVLALPPAIDASVELGFAADAVPWIGLVELACLALYVAPRTSPVGAVLLTGYLGGAIATHLRMQSPLSSHTLFPLYVAALIWLPLQLRDTRVQALLGPARAGTPASDAKQNAEDVSSPSSPPSPSRT